MHSEKDHAGYVCEPVRLARQSLWGEGNRLLSVCRSLPGEIIIAFFLYFLLQRILVPVIGSFVFNMVLFPLFGEGLIDFMTPVQAWLEIIMMAGFIAYMRFVQRRNFAAMGFIRKKWALWYVMGFGCGLILFSIAMFLSVVLSGGSIVYSGSLSPQMFFAALTGWMIQGMAEEVDGRGYMFLSITRKHREYVGVLASGLFFGMIHINNSGATVLSVLNTTLWGFLFCLLLVVTENIWFIGALHTAWNLAQGNVFGVLVSGNDPGAAIFRAELTGENVLLTGGAYGIEGNAVTTAVVLVMIVAALLIIRKKERDRV